MNKDIHPLDQPKGSFRYALNAAIETVEGDLGRISNELGHLSCADIPEGKSIINYEALPDNKYVIFLKGEVDEIGLLDRCVYSTLFEDECLSFGENLYSSYRVRKGCETVVYFTDYTQPVRAITVETPPTTCEELNLFLGAQRPGIEVDVRPLGGSVEAGSYIFGVRYLDGNLNATEWLQFSRPVNTLITSSSYDDPAGLTGTSTTSFVINLSDTDGRYPYFQIGVIPYNSGTGTPGTVLVSPRQRTNSGKYTFTGNITGFTTTTIEDVLVEANIFSRAKYITQLENRLILAGIAERQEDWCTYQKTVNKIAVGYKIVEVPTKDATAKGDTWNPDYGEQMSYMADEVYSFGIVYVFKDGTTSPVFHIPGRAPTNYDTLQLTVTSAFPDSTQIRDTEVEHLGFQIGQKVPRWKATNTSQGGGQMAYYESSQSTYPETLDCEGQPVWDDLAGQPIRHHRFPGRKVEPHIQDGLLRHLGVTFDNVQYPSDDIVGHFFVRGTRDDAERTILDKGVFFEAWDADGVVAVGEMKQDPKQLNNNNTVSLVGDTVAAMTPRVLSGDGLFAGHMRLDYYLNYVGGPESYQYDVQGAINDKLAVHAEVRKYDQGTTSISFANKAIDTQLEMPARFIKEVGSDTYRNGSFTNTFQLLKSTHDFGTQQLLYGALKQSVDPFDVLEVIEYVPIGSKVETATYSEHLGGDTFITEMAVGNILDIDGGLYNTGGFFGTQQPRANLFSSYVSSVYVESTVNFLPTPGDSNCERYYTPKPEHLNPTFDIQILEYLLSLSSDIDENLVRTYVFPCPLVYDLAQDFFVQDRYRIYTPLKSNYDCCNQCAAEFDNRIVYSEASFQEEDVDQYRVFLANNYHDLDGGTGEISQIKRWEDRLIIFTQEGVWYLPPQLQERVNSEGIVSYVGTGSFFGIPPKKFIASKTSGCTDPRTIIDTPEGIFFYDGRSGIPYMVGRSLQPINQGMRRWFLEASKRGGTLHAGYDEEFSRILLTSKGDGCGQEWTLSYSLLAKEWISFHSYVPDMYMTGKREFIVVDDKFYTANEGNYNMYGGKEYPFVIEAIQKSAETKVWDAIEYYTEVERDGVEERWSTFDQLWVYNNYQSTGIIPLVTRQSQENVNLMLNRLGPETDVDRDERNWRINSLRSIVNSESKVYAANCELYLSDILPANFQPMQWFHREPLRSKYLHIRFIFSILDNRKITYFYEKI